MPTPRILLSIAAVATSLPMSAPARAAAPGVVGALPASACAALFGRAETHQANRARRAELLYWVAGAGTAETIAVAHASDHWQRPAPLVLDGVRVIGVAGARATVSVTPQLAARVGCRAATYALGRDMSIGRSAVLWVLGAGLLIERRGQLRFVARAGARRPDWQMIWGSPYEAP